MRKLFKIASAFGAILFLIFLFTTAILIGRGVRNNCKSAQNNYSGDCVGALIQLVENEENSYSARNSGIWALGQLGDKRALPILRDLYTGEIPPREPIDKAISQYELKKAIKLARGDFNATAVIWRNKLFLPDR